MADSVFSYTALALGGALTIKLVQFAHTIAFRYRSIPIRGMTGLAFDRIHNRVIIARKWDRTDG